MPKDKIAVHLMKKNYANKFCQFQRIFLSLVLIGVYMFTPNSSKGLGVLTHEAVVDAAWEKTILPLLKERFPQSTEEELTNAHAYAYGGAVSPDMGYYPFGNPYFTDLVHYVRSGEMAEALLTEAQTLNELAFAIGFLSHYYADNYGHPEATNISVPLIYPKMQRKFGDTVTYAENKISHMRMEFGFDVLQTARGNYASKDYHNFIGFKVDTAVLSRAFQKTYGISLKKTFHGHLSFTVEFFRFMVANVFPLITRTAWARRKSDILKVDSTATAKSFRYKNRIREYNKEFGKGYQSPGFFPTLLSVFVRIIPKVGPFRALKFKVPNEKSEKYFVESFDALVARFEKNVKQVNNPGFSLKNFDFDTGELSQHCEYTIADGTFNKWLLELSDNNFEMASDPIKKDILSYYSGFKKLPVETQCKKCREVFATLQELRETE